MKDLERNLKNAQEYLKTKVKKVIGVEAVNHYKKSFRDEGFTDRSTTKWQEVKRRTEPKSKSSAKGRKILTGETKQLSDGIDYEETSSSVNITTDVVYAKVHNEGGRAGKNGSAEIPKRQFIGESKTLENTIQNEIENDLTTILNQ